jgi:hypothetical protein
MRRKVMTAEHAKRVSVILAGFFLLAGCGSSGGNAEEKDVVSTETTVQWDELEPPQAAQIPQLSYTITNEGSGPTNADVLDPLRPGQLLTVSSKFINSRVVAGPVLLGKDEVMEIWYARDADGMPGASWERHTADGMVRYGTSDGGPFAEASLLVPTTVRVGMSWDLQFSDFEVMNRTEAVTPWGKKPVWTIEQRYHHDDSKCTRVYVEGHGLLSDSCLLLGPVDGAIELLGDEQFTAPEAVEMMPLAGGGVAFEMDTAAGQVWAVDIAPGDKPMIMSVIGAHRPSFLEAGMDTNTHRCLEVSPEGGAYEISPPPVQTSFVSGGNYEVMRGPPTCPYGLVKKNSWSDLGDRHASNAWMRPDGSGGVWYGRSQADGTIYTKNGHFVSDSLLALVGFGNSEPQSIFWNAITQHQWQAFATLSGQLVGGDPVMGLTPPHSTGDALIVGLIMPSGALVQADLDLEMAFTVPRSGPFAGPFRTIRTTPQRQDILLASPGGAIDRLVLVDGEWQRQPVVNVSLPYAAAGVVGAFALEGTGDSTERLLVMTRSFLTITFTDNGEVVKQFLDPFSHLFTVAVPETPPVRPWLGALSVTAEKLGADMRVCWKAAGEPETEGWTLGGATPGAVLAHFEDSRCVAVFRDPEKALPVDEPGAMVVEGPIPGVGRVRIAMMPGAETTDSFGGGAPLTAGGFVSSKALYGPGGVKVKAMNLIYPYAEYYDDLAGHGMWYLHPGGDESGLYLVNENGLNYITNFGYFQTTTQGGGIVISGVHEEKRWIQPDGTELELPHLNAEAYGVLSNGTQCGSRMTWNMNVSGEQEVSCVTLDGEVHILGLGVTEFWFMKENKDWMPMDDEHFLIYNPELDSTRIVDGIEFTIAPYEDGQIESHTFDAEGRLYGLLKGNWYEFTLDGPIQLELSGYEERTTTVLVGQEVYILTLDDGTLRRVPR